MAEVFERRDAKICIATEWPSGDSTWVLFWPCALTIRYVKVGATHLRGDEFIEAMQHATI